MIKLDVQDYCHDCADFEPRVQLPTILYGNDGSKMIVGDTIVDCEDSTRCARLYGHIKQGMEEKSSNENN